MITISSLPFAAFILAGTTSGAPAPTPGAAAPAAAPAAATKAGAEQAVTPPISVTVTNPLAAPRARETIALGLASLAKTAPGFALKTALVVDATGKPVLSQLVDLDGDESPDEIVFQTDLGAKETKTFKVTVGKRGPAARADYKAYGRFVRERHDDFAWENDLVAHRVYGPDLETCKQEPLTSSGVDTWVKRVPKLIVNDWYMTDDYHQDHGEGADFYGVGKTRGCGGLGIWANGKLNVSKNFTHSRVLAQGPIRLVFELTYAPWEAGSMRVAETRRVVLDAGTHFNRIESAFTGAAGALFVGLGISKHKDSAVKVDGKRGWMRTWEPLDDGKSGNLGCAIVLPPDAKSQEQHLDGDYLLVTATPASGLLTYYAGSGWDRGGSVADATAWAKQVQSLADRLAAPVKVTLAVAKAK
jgi:hypothetical protein